jgi:hypothetical protein
MIMMIGFFRHVTLCCCQHDAGRCTFHSEKSARIVLFYTKMEAKLSSETPEFIIQTTRRHTPQ